MTILKRGKPTASVSVEVLRKELLNGSDIVKFSMNIPRQLHNKFKKKTFMADLDMKDVLIEAIHKYLST